jgi:hypothetical protein
MDKDTIVNALNAIQNGASAAKYYDEMEVVIGLVMNATDADIAAVVAEIHEDTDSADPKD